MTRFWKRDKPILIGAMIDMMETHRPAAPSPVQPCRKSGKFVEDATVQKKTTNFEYAHEDQEILV